MIIEPKSTRQNATQGDPRKRFEFNTSERLSRIPLYIALFVVAVAAYVKSAFAETPPATPPDEENPNPDEAAEPVPEEIDPTTTGSIEEGPEPRIRVGRGLPWEAEFLPPDPPALVFANTFEPYQMVLDPFLPSAFSLWPSNDNAGDWSDAGDPVGGAPISGGTAGPKPVDDDQQEPGGDEDEDDDDTETDGGGNDPDPDDDEDDGDDDDDSGQPANRLPTVAGPVRLQDVFAGQVALIGLSELLFGAHDADGDPLHILNLTVDGAPVSPTEGGWLLTTQHGTLGPVTLTYRISDGEGSVWQTAYLEITRNVEILTPADDVHVGTPYDDDIDGREGDDIIDAGEGYDLVEGGAGDDHIVGGNGNDHLNGGSGHDVIFGGAGDDVIKGGAGDDRLFGDSGKDIVNGEAGDDALFGGADDDVLDGDEGDDRLHGEGGNDVLLGDEGCDVLDGGAGDDVLLGGKHDDVLVGKSGNDVLEGGQGNDQLDGGAGDDSLAGDSGCDVLIGGAGADVLAGGADADVIAAGDGDDTIVGDAGDDDLDGGEGFDVLDLTMATASVFVDYIEGTVSGDDVGTDTFTGIEQVDGGGGDDVFILGATATVTSGGRGRDTFVFEVIDEAPSLSEAVVHEILDFVVGDRVRVRDYDMDRSARQAQNDLFKAIYEDDDDDWLKSDLPILTRHERYDDIDHTIIQADIDHDNIYEITINIHGIHLPLANNTELA